MTGTLSEEEASAIMAGGLGEAELKFIMSITAPLFWVMRESDGTFKARNGSVFFLDAGKGVFAVTATHVVDGWRKDSCERSVVGHARSSSPKWCRGGAHGFRIRPVKSYPTYPT